MPREESLKGKTFRLFCWSPWCNYDIDKKSPVCKHPLMVRMNKKNQKFISCTNFPRCTFTESIEDEVRDFAAEKMK